MGHIYIYKWSDDDVEQQANVERRASPRFRNRRSHHQTISDYKRYQAFKSMLHNKGKGVKVTKRTKKGEIRLKSMNDVRKRFSSDPQTIQEAMSRADWPMWKKAIESEFGSIEKSDTWDEALQADTPTSEKVVRSRLVFTIKCNAQCARRGCEVQSKVSCARRFTRSLYIWRHLRWSCAAKICDAIAKSCKLLRLANFYSRHNCCLSIWHLRQANLYEAARWAIRQT